MKAISGEVDSHHSKQAGIITTAPKAASVAIPKHLESLINSYATKYEAQGVSFSPVNPEAFKKMIGFTGDGTPLREVLDRHSPFGSDKILESLRDASLRGRSPKQIAREMTQEDYSDLGHALLVARTETMRVAHEVGMENFRENGIDRIQWVSGETAETCAACWAMSGKIFDIDRVPHDHPNGRCGFNPYIPELAELDPELYEHNPEEAFAELSEEEQLAVLGPARLEALNSEEISLGDLAETVENESYGESIRIKSLVGLGLAPQKIDKSPAEVYNIDEAFADKFNQMTPEMQELFAPYLQDRGVSGFFDDSKVDDNIKNAAGYKSPIDLALQIQEYALEQFPDKSPAELAAKMTEKFSTVDYNDFGFESTPPLYCVADVIKELDNEQGESSSRELLREWEVSSWTTYSTEIKKGMELIWGGTFYDNREDSAKSEPLDPLAIAYKMRVLKAIYDDSRKLPGGLKTGEPIKLHRGYAGNNAGLDNSASSWSDTYSMAEDIATEAAIIRANNMVYDFIDNSPLKGKARDKKIREIIDKEADNWDVESRDINSDFVLTGFGILPPDEGFEFGGQREFLVIGGLLQK